MPEGDGEGKGEAPAPAPPTTDPVTGLTEDQQQRIDEAEAVLKKAAEEEEHIKDLKTDRGMQVAMLRLLQKMEGKINGDTTPDASDEVPNNDSDKQKVPREQYYDGRYSEEERVPLRGIMTAKTMPFCQHNKPYREAKIGSKYFASDLQEMPEKMEKWKDSFPDGLLQQVMKNDSYSTYVCSNTKVSDFIASSIEKRIQELIKLKYNIHRIDRLVISDVDGSNNKGKKLFNLAKYSTFPPSLDEKIYKWELIDASPEDDDTQCDLYCIPNNFGSSDLTRKPAFVPLRSYFSEYIQYLLLEVQKNSIYRPNPRRVPSAGERFLDREHMDLEEFQKFDSHLFDYYMNWLKSSMHAMHQPARIDDITRLEMDLRRTRNCSLIYAALQWTYLHLCGNSGVVVKSIRHHVDEVRNNAFSRWPEVDVCHILSFYLSADMKLKLFAPRNVSAHAKFAARPRPR